MAQAATPIYAIFADNMSGQLCYRKFINTLFYSKKTFFRNKYLRMSEKNSNFAAEMNEGTRKGSLNFIKNNDYGR